MKRFTWMIGSLVLLAVWMVAVVALGQDPTASPTPFETVGDAVKETADAAKAAQAAGWSLATVMAFAIAILKAFWMAVGRVPALAKKVKKWGVEINVLIPALIGLAYVFVGGGSWAEAVMVIATGPLMGFIHDGATWIWKLKKKAGPSANLDDGNG